MGRGGRDGMGRGRCVGIGRGERDGMGRGRCVGMDRGRCVLMNILEYAQRMRLEQMFFSCSSNIG